MMYILENITEEFVEQTDKLSYLINGGDIFDERGNLIWTWATKSPSNLTSALASVKDDIISSKINFKKLYVQFSHRIIFSQKIDSILKTGKFSLEHSNWLFPINEFDVVNHLIAENLLIIGGEFYDVNFEYSWHFAINNAKYEHNDGSNVMLSLIAEDIKKQIGNCSKNGDLRYYSLSVKNSV